MRRYCSVPLATCFTAALLFSAVSQSGALEITNYSATVNDRFSSGYPTAPVANTDPSFIGLGFDFSGVGWDTADATKSFALLSPGNYLVARHYGGASTIAFQGASGQLYSYTQQSVQDSDYGVVFSGQTVGDISIGTFATPIDSSTQIQPYAVLDESPTTATQLLLYGRGADGNSSTRMGATLFVGGNISSTNTSFIVTSRTDVQMESGDSGSPTFIPWTDPTGAQQLTIVGNNAGIDSTYNYLNYLNRPEAVAAINSIMAQTGYALRWVSDPNATWLGGSGSHASSFGAGSNWSNSVAVTGTTPYLSYLAFNTASASTTTVDLGGTTRSARGLIFDPGTASFTLQNGMLSLGRGGLNNYDTHVETLNNNFTLTDDQYWDGRNGGFNVSGAVDTGGNLFIVQGSADSTLSGAISGSGSFAKDGTGTVTLSGNNTYSGTTFIHNGTLKIAGGSALPDSGVIYFDNLAHSLLDVNGTTETVGALTGGGTTGGNVVLHGGALSLSGASAGTFNGSISLENGTLTVGGANTQTFGGSITSNGTLIKNGQGVLVLNGQSSFTGQTTINGGVLVAGNTGGSATGTSAVTVSGGTLAGFGAIAGNVVVAAGAHVTAGNFSSSGQTVPSLNTSTQSQNILTLGGNLTINGALDFYLGALSDSTGYTALLLNGASPVLQIGSTASFTLSSTSFEGIGDPNSGLAFWNSSHVWTIADVGGSNSITGTFTNVNLGTWSQGTFALDYNTGTGNDLTLSFTPANPVPEPGTIALTVAGALVLLKFGGKIRRVRRA